METESNRGRCLYLSYNALQEINRIRLEGETVSETLVRVFKGKKSKK